MDNYLVSSSSKKSSKSKDKNGGGTPKEELKDPSPEEVRQLVLDYLSHHVYLSTARALSLPRSPPATDLAPIEVNLPPSSSSSTTTTTATANPNPFDPNGESEDAMMVEVEEEVGRPLDPDGDALMDASEPTQEGGSSGNGTVEGMEVLGELTNGEDAKAAEAGRIEGRFSEDELAQIEHRRDIKTQILLGNIPGALSLIKLHYPTFISSATSPTDPPASSSTSSPIKNGTNPSPTVKLPPPTSSNGSSSSSNLLQQPSSSSSSASLLKLPSATPSPAYHLPSSSLLPIHIHLNILIQGFIETIRTVPLSPPSSSSSSPINSNSNPAIHPHPHRTPSSSSSNSPTNNGTTSLILNGNGNGNGGSMSASFHSLHSNGNGTASSSPSSSTQSLSSTVSTKTVAALTQAQDLYVLVDKLTSEKDKEWYRKAVVEVSGLFAYVPPESAPTRSFLGRERRQALAENVNAALLAHSGHPSAPSLETLVRRTTVVWDQLANQSMNTVPPWGKEDGMEWAKLGDYLSEHKAFLLREFLDA
ncbi:hypothetical protein BDY24DRAFT_380617 [Mrakia frigida]|uniref:uncharacterized protein n=1 Tax=Mrakia frigida TaxID=29902 RepID=UPI003FCC259F